MRSFQYIFYYIMIKNCRKRFLFVTIRIMNKLKLNIFLSLLFLLYLNHVCAMAPKLNWEKAIDKAIIRYGLKTEPELISFFTKANVTYPPSDIAFLAFKQERKIELWARNSSQRWRFIHSYPLTAFSGRLGPKLKEHDRQIPEGIYRLVNFNPFSSMHLSMMINYPNSYDKLQAIKDGRRQLGNGIFIHGKSAFCWLFGRG